MNDPENTEGMARTTEQIANAGSGTYAGTYADSAGDSGAGSTGQYPLPGARPAHSDQAERATADGDVGTGGQPHAQLLEDQELQAIRGQWKDIQAEFVDEPRKAVQQADALVAELMQRLAQMFATEREGLESRWAGGDDVSTEDLRRGLRRYRSFFERLLVA
jgi:hypothetical protein